VILPFIRLLWSIRGCYCFTTIPVVFSFSLPGVQFTSENERPSAAKVSSRTLSVVPLRPDLRLRFDPLVRAQVGAFDEREHGSLNTRAQCLVDAFPMRALIVDVRSHRIHIAAAH
jgi:hypothetical protein